MAIFVFRCVTQDAFEDLADSADGLASTGPVCAAGRRTFRTARSARPPLPARLSTASDGVCGQVGWLRLCGTEEQPAQSPSPWSSSFVRWPSKSMLKDFGFFRSRWSCGLVGLAVVGAGTHPRQPRLGLLGDAHWWEFVGVVPGETGRAASPSGACPGKAVQQIRSRSFIGPPPAKRQLVVFED